MCQDHLPDSAATDADQIGPDVDDGPPRTDIPDTTSLLRDQASTLRSLTREPPSPEGWERVMQLWCEATEIVATTVKLPPASGDRPACPINPHNAMDIQRLSIGATTGGVPSDSSLTAPPDSLVDKQ